MRRKNVWNQLQFMGRILTGIMACSLVLAGCDRGDSGKYTKDTLANNDMIESQKLEENSQNDETTQYSEDTEELSEDTEEFPEEDEESKEKAESKEEKEKLQEEEKERQQEPTQSDRLTICMVGDVLMHDRLNESGKQEDGSYNYDHLFANVKSVIETYDIAIVNQEVILGGTELGLSGYPTFNSAFELGDALVSAGFDVVLHATNHAMDKGVKGVLRCLDFWRSCYPTILVLGIHETQEERNEIPIIERNGIKIAILDATYGMNGIRLPEDMPYLVNLLDKEKVGDDIRQAKEQADFVIVTPHWGTEYQLEASEEQEDLAEYFMECGADLVIGTHPHVIEPVEWIYGEDGKKMLVYYSIGNFINATSGTGEGVANRMVGAIAELTLSVQEDGEVAIQEYGVEPIVSHISEEPKQMTTYLLSDYTESMAQKNLILEQDSSFSKEYCEQLCEKIFGDFYKTSKLLIISK